MDTKKLRQKILDLAIHGKLVPQDPNDEPASVLLERIREEKDRLIKEGKIKKSKSTASSDTSHYENVPFEVPDGWCWVKIRDLCYYLGGYAFKSTQYVASSDNQVIRIGNVKDDKILLESQPVFITDDYAATAESALLRNNDLLFTMTGTKGKRDYFKTSLVRVNKKRLFLNQRVGCLRSYSTHVYMEYLCFAMKHTCVLDAIFQTETGNVSQGNIGSENTLDLLIPLPPLNEQKRIIQRFQDCISDIDSVELNTIELKKVMERLKSKILDLAIHGKLVPQNNNDEPAYELLKRINPKAVASCDNPQYGKVPSSWVISTVGEVFTINPKTHVEDNIEAAFVPMTCVADGYSNTFEYECRKWGYIKKGFVHFQENDVAVAKISPCLENRKSVVFHDLPNGIGAGTTELNVFRCEEILPEYALFYFKSQMFIGSCAGTYNGVVGQQRVSKSFIQELPIGIPPYKEQMRIVSKVNDLFSQLDMIEKSLQA